MRQGLQGHRCCSGIGGLAAAVSLLRVEFDVDVYEKAPQLNEVSGDIRGGVP
jgi:2-polyprenyl-6-methoxyphenol hydroxylase-like FAD-dependent oxidoreductase